MVKNKIKAAEFKEWLRKEKTDRGGKFPIFDLPKRPDPPKAIIIVNNSNRKQVTNK